MKSLKEYIVSEKLHFKKGMNSEKTVKIEVPKVDEGWVPNSDEAWEVWRKIELPKTKYVIYNDVYRESKMHFAGLGDLIGEFIFFQDDYEDWDPKKQIYYASDDLDEILKWYFEKLELPMEIFDETDFRDAFAMVEGSLDESLTVDSVDFLAKAAIGEWGEDKITVDYIITDDDMKDKKSTKAWFRKNF